MGRWGSEKIIGAERWESGEIRGEGGWVEWGIWIKWWDEECEEVSGKGGLRKWGEEGDGWSAEKNKT